MGWGGFEVCFLFPVMAVRASWLSHTSNAVVPKPDCRSWGRSTASQLNFLPKRLNLMVLPNSQSNFPSLKSSCSYLGSLWETDMLPLVLVYISFFLSVLCHLCFIIVWDTFVGHYFINVYLKIKVFHLTCCNLCSYICLLIILHANFLSCLLFVSITSIKSIKLKLCEILQAVLF